MGKLNCQWNGRNCAQAFDNVTQRRLVFIVVKTQVAVGNAALWTNGGCFQAKQAGAGYGKRTKVHDMPRNRVAIDSGILAHG